MARRPSETLFSDGLRFLQNALSVAPARAEPGLKHSFSCLSMLAFAKMLKQLSCASGRLLPAVKKEAFYKDRPVCFMKIVDFMRTITPFHGVHTYADTNRRRYD